MAFHGRPRCGEEIFEHVHESPPIMIIPLIPLAFGAIFAGWFGYQLFVGYDMAYFWGESLFILPENKAMEEAHYVPVWVKRFPVLLAATGVSLAVFAYVIIPTLPAVVISIAKPIHRLFFNKWFFDELYTRLLVVPAKFLGRIFWIKFDGGIINKIINLVSLILVPYLSKNAGNVQTRFVTHYAFAMILGLVAITLSLAIFVSF